MRDVPKRIWMYLVSRVFDRTATAGLVTIVGKQLWDMTEGRPDSERLLVLGYLGLVQFVPTFVLAPFVGPLADRFDRRYVAATGLGIYSVLSAALFLYVRTDPSDIIPIFVIMGVQGATEALQRPASRALPIDLSPTNIVPRVMALNSGSFQAGSIVGPILAGVLFTVAPALPYAAFLVMFAIGGVLILSLPASGVARLKNTSGATGGVGVLKDAIEGFRFVRATPVLGAAVTMDFFAAFFGGLRALLPAIADELLGVGAIGLGGLRAAGGIGAAIVTIVLAFRPLRRQIGPVLLVCVAIYGVATIGVAFSTNYVLAFGLLMILSGADAVSVFIRSTLVPLATPPNMRGRVLAMENVFIGASNELGGYESGVTAAWFGLIGAIALGGVGTLLVVGAYAFVFKSLLRVDTFEDVTPDGVPSQLDTAS